MRKEVLTPDRCRKDVLALQHFDRRIIWYLLVADLPMTLMIGFLVAIGYSMQSKIAWEVPVALGAIVVLVAGTILFLFCHERYRIRKIKTGELLIVEDLLVLSYEDVERRARREYSKSVRFFVLEFQHMGPYRVPQQSYEWSKLYPMSDEGVFNTSALGDRFYVVYLKNARKPQPLAVYNTKLFELCPDGTEPRTGSSWRDSVNVE